MNISNPLLKNLSEKKKKLILTVRLTTCDYLLFYHDVIQVVDLLIFCPRNIILLIKYVIMLTQQIHFLNFINMMFFFSKLRKTLCTEPIEKKVTLLYLFSIIVEKTTLLFFFKKKSK